MELKHTEVGAVLLIKRRLTIPEIGAASAACCDKVFLKASELGLEVTGPWHFIAYNLPQDIETPFDIEFCLPVSSADGLAIEDEISTGTLGNFYCASRTYKGSLQGLFELGYQPLVAQINAANGRYTGESREIYHVWQGPESDSNVVEIQFGLLESGSD
ncbi:hypothetical protein [Aliagarivorans marinus]|uniref:hypothetical protein n=1 Tax=Aliagarivorans marinus TaxID=561965 RepID=UPI00041E2B4A|nr:hypothetical protein [Aliagarivorans marinus]